VFRVPWNGLADGGDLWKGVEAIGKVRSLAQIECQGLRRAATPNQPHNPG